MLWGLLALAALGLALASSKKAETALTSPVATDKKSGMIFKSQQAESFKDGMLRVDVFLLPAGTRVLTYQQQGSDNSSREAVASPAGTPQNIVAAAMRAYGVVVT